MSPQEAASILKLELSGLTDEKINEAFRSAVRRSHPDANIDSPARLAATALQHQKKARDALRKYVEATQAMLRCLRCDGKGYLPGSVVTVLCPNCRGRGK